MLKKLFLILFFITAFITNANALSFTKKQDLVSLTVTPEYKTLSPDTQTISFIIKANIKPNWHLYWDNPGDTGDPVVLTFYDSPHYQEQSSHHTAPIKSVFEEIITSYIYKKELYFLVTFSLNDLQNLDRLPFEIILSYTACNVSCLPGSTRLSLALPIKEKPEINPTFVTLAPIAKSTFPEQLYAAASLNNDLMELKLDEQIIKNCKEPEFVSLHPKKSILANLPETTVAAKNQLNVNFDKDELPPDPKGILLCPGHVYYITPTPEAKPLSAASHSTPLPSPDKTFYYYLFTAFLAGLILNLMPCVLPVLGLKALYLANHSDQASPLSALFYTLGVLSSFLTLSAILYYLRQLGLEQGWGFQLQSPTFNAILLLLFFLIFLNLIDKLPLPDCLTDKLNRLSGNKSFLTGFFAVLVACPCTGPFMGAAVGYAITTPAPIYFGIFISLSLGYALPYALVESFPSFFLKFLPKPGAWMITLKHFLAIPIALTCFWLGWVIFNQLSLSAPKTEITWQPYSEQALKTALKQNKAVLINFTAKWCLICLLNDKTALSTKTFKEMAQKHNLTLLKADWTNRNPDIAATLKTYNRNSIPLYVYYPSSNTPYKILPQILTVDILTQTLETPK